jgi:tetratricopeptide (TPR) repeat protein
LGQEENASRERRRIGEALQTTLARDNVEAGTLNALAWFCATSDIYLEESLQAAERAAELEPENSGILDTLAEVLFRLGRAEDALRTIDRAIALDPDDEYLQRQRARFERR